MLLILEVFMYLFNDLLVHIFMDLFLEHFSQRLWTYCSNSLTVYFNICSLYRNCVLLANILLCSLYIHFILLIITEKNASKYLNKSIHKKLGNKLDKNIIKLVSKNLNKEFYKKIVNNCVKILYKNFDNISHKNIGYGIFTLVYLYTYTFLVNLLIFDITNTYLHMQCSYFKNSSPKTYPSKIYILKTLFYEIYLSKSYPLKIQILYINHWLKTRHKDINILFKNYVGNSHISMTNIHKLNVIAIFIFYSLKSMRPNIVNICYKHIKFVFSSLNRYLFITYSVITHSINLIPLLNLNTEIFMTHGFKLKDNTFCSSTIIVSTLSILTKMFCKVHILVPPNTLLFQIYQVMLNWYHG